MPIMTKITVGNALIVQSLNNLIVDCAVCGIIKFQYR